MPRIWAIYPFDSKPRKAFDQAWKYDSNHGVITIGWDLGDISGVSNDEIRRRYDKGHFGEPRGYLNLQRWSTIECGDRIIACGGRTKIIGLGTALAPPYYSPEEAKNRMDIKHHPNVLRVQWESYERHIFTDMVFGRYTVSQMSETSKHWLILKAALSKIWDVP